VTTALSTALILGIVAGFLLERHFQARAFADERKGWTRERSELLNRIKPETAQPVDNGPVETPEQPAFDDDAGYWKLREAS
jgi:primase-polymerase (primpol)-like protein